MSDARTELVPLYGLSRQIRQARQQVRCERG